MDPISQILAQQSSGSAEGQGFGADYARGQEFSLRERYLSLQQKAEKRAQKEQDVLLPLKAEFDRSQNTILGQQAFLGLQKQLTIEASNNSLPQIYELQRRIATSPNGVDDPEIQKDLLQISLQNPRAVAPGTPGGDLWTWVQSSAVFKSRLKQVQDANAQLKGQNIYVREATDKGTMQFGIRDDEDRALRRQNELTRLNLERERLRLSGNAQGLREVDQRIKLLSEGYDVQGLPEPVFTPYGASPVAVPGAAPTPDALSPSTNQPTPITIKPIERPTTPAETTRLQEQNIQADEAIQAIGSLEQNIRQNPDALGIRGIVKGGIETVRGQLDPTADARVLKAREQAGLTFVQLSKGLRVDTGNMSRYERNKLEDIGDMTKWEKYPQAALEQAGAIKDMIIARKLRVGKALHSPPDSGVLSLVSPVELPALVKSSLIDDDALLTLYELGKISAEDASRLHDQLPRKLK